MRDKFYTRIDNDYEFKCFYGNFQKLKYDSKKDDYYVTLWGDRYYLNDCLRNNGVYYHTNCIGQTIEHENKNNAREYEVIGTWQEGYTVYELQCKDTTDFCEDSLVRVVYCPPSNQYVGA